MSLYIFAQDYFYFCFVYFFSLVDRIHCYGYSDSSAAGGPDNDGQGRHFIFFQGGKISTDFLGGGGQNMKNTECCRQNTKNHYFSKSGGGGK